MKRKVKKQRRFKSKQITVFIFNINYEKYATKEEAREVLKDLQ